MAEKLSGLDEVLDALEAKFQKAKNEILSELEKIRTADPDLTPESLASLARLREVADALDAIVPDAAPPVIEPPVEPPVEPPPSTDPVV